MEREFSGRVGSSRPSAQSQMHRVESPTQGDGDNEPVETVGPCIVFLPSHATEEEWNNIMNFAENGVGQSGSAAMGKMGHIVGSVDIGESDDAYFFRVSLPGVAMDGKEFSCDIKPDGKVLIKGVTTAGESKLCNFSQIFRMQTQILCPPGHFSISFLLPGPVYPQPISSNSGINGMLEMMVRKKKNCTVSVIKDSIPLYSRSYISIAYFTFPEDRTL